MGPAVVELIVNERVDAVDTMSAIFIYSRLVVWLRYLIVIDHTIFYYNITKKY